MRVKRRFKTNVRVTSQTPVYYSGLFVTSAPWPFVLLVVGDSLIKPHHLLEIAVNLSFSSYALVARHKQEAHFGWEFSFFIDSFCWPMDETEPSLKGKAWLISVQFLLNIYNSPLCFWNTINWQLQLYCHLKLIIKFAFQVGISLEISL